MNKKKFELKNVKQYSQNSNDDNLGEIQKKVLRNGR